MFQTHKIATTIGAIGAAIVLAHVFLGPDIMPVPGAIAGLILAAAAGLRLITARRHETYPDNRRSRPRR